MQRLAAVLPLALALAGGVSAFTPSVVPLSTAQIRASSIIPRSRLGPARLGSARQRAPLRRGAAAGAVQLRANIDGTDAEGRKFKIGDAVEAEWIGDDCFYPGTIEGYFTEGRYDVKWAGVCVCVCVCV